MVFGRKFLILSAVYAKIFIQEHYRLKADFLFAGE